MTSRDAISDAALDFQVYASSRRVLVLGYIALLLVPLVPWQWHLINFNVMLAITAGILVAYPLLVLTARVFPRLADRYLIVELVSAMTWSLALFTFIFLMDVVFALTEMLVNKGVAFVYVIRLFFYVLPNIMKLTVPMAVLLATIYSYTRIAADNEFTAMRACGIGLMRLAFPALLISLLLSLVMVWFNDQTVPKSNHAYRQLMFNIVRKKATMELKQKVFNRNFGNIVLYAKKLDDRTAMMHDVTVFQKKSGSLTSIVVAEEGKMIPHENEHTVVLHLYHGIIHELIPNNIWSYRVGRFQSQLIDIELDTELRSRTLSRRRTIDKTNAELAATIKRMTKGRPTRKSRSLLEAVTTLNMRYTIPFACLAFAMVGVPLGLKTRKRTKEVGVGLAVAFIVIYYVFMLGGKTFSTRGLVKPFIAMWSGDILFFIIGIILLIRMRKN